MERKVRNAAKALIIQDNKMLAIKISDGKEEWYIMPGGGQDAEELLPDTVCREVAEELGLKVEEVREFPIDGTNHAVIVLRKVAPTPKQFPRRFAKIKQAPL